MNYHLPKNSAVRGIAPLIILIIIAIVAAAAGGGYVVATRTEAGKKLVAKVGAMKTAVVEKAGGEPAADEGVTAATGVDAIQIAAPTFDFSFSPVPSLDASAFNVGAPSVVSASGAFSGLNIKADLTVDTDLSIEMPTIDPNELKPKTLAQPAAPTTPTTPAAPTTPPGGGQQGTSVSASTCAQFASMPNASICAQVGDPNGRTLCEQCKAAGF